MLPYYDFLLRSSASIILFIFAWISTALLTSSMLKLSYVRLNLKKCVCGEFNEKKLWSRTSLLIVQTLNRIDSCQFYSPCLLSVLRTVLLDTLKRIFNINLSHSHVLGYLEFVLIVVDFILRRFYSSWVCLLSALREHKKAFLYKSTIYHIIQMHKAPVTMSMAIINRRSFINQYKSK